MLSSSSLSLEQAPPIDIPFRFFLTAPLFGMLAAVLALSSDAPVFLSRWSPTVLAITHWLTLGFMTMIMMGAIMQMMPVLTGAPVARVAPLGALVHVALLVGSLLLGITLLTGQAGLGMLAAGLLLASILVFAWGVLSGLLRSPQARSAAVSSALIMAIGLLVSTAIMGLLLIGDFSGAWSLIYTSAWTDLHLTLGFGGWLAVLFVGLAIQIVPMFHVTPAYPGWMKKYLPLALSVLTIIWTIVFSARFLMGLPKLSGWLVFFLYSALILSFAFVTIKLHRQRARKVSDITILYWNLGLALGVAALILLNLDRDWVGRGYEMLVGILLLPGLALSMIQGMLYRIVPFLSWFHLQHLQITQGKFDRRLPHMKAFIPDRSMHIQFAVHLGSLVMMVLAVYFPHRFEKLAILGFLISNLLLAINLWLAVRKFYVIRASLLAPEQNESGNLHPTH